MHPFHLTTAVDSCAAYRRCVLRLLAAAQVQTLAAACKSQYACGAQSCIADPPAPCLHQPTHVSSEQQQTSLACCLPSAAARNAACSHALVGGVQPAVCSCSAYVAATHVNNLGKQFCMFRQHVIQQHMPTSYMVCG